MAQALSIIQKLGAPSHGIFEGKTDSILFDPGRHGNRIKEALANTTFADLPGLLKQEAGQQRLDDFYGKIDGVSSRDTVGFSGAIPHPSRIASTAKDSCQ